MKDVNEFIIFPAKFIEKIDDEESSLNIYVEDDDKAIVRERTVKNNMIKHIKNPTYLFIGLIESKNHTEITFADGKEYEDLFHEKWDILN